MAQVEIPLPIGDPVIVQEEPGLPELSDFDGPPPDLPGDAPPKVEQSVPDPFSDLGASFKTLVLSDGSVAQSVLFPTEVQQRFGVNLLPGEALSITFRLRRYGASGELLTQNPSLVTKGAQAVAYTAFNTAAGYLGAEPAVPPAIAAGATFIFSLNPQKVDVSKGKVFQYMLTNGGYLLQTWGNNCIDFDLSCTTDSLSAEIEMQGYPSQGIPQLGIPPPPQSSLFGIPPVDDSQLALNAQKSPQLGIYATKSYKFFKLLEFYFDYFNGGNEGVSGNRLLSVMAPADTTLSFGVWGGSYEGILHGLTYGLDANDPFRIKYNLKFRAYPKLVAPSLYNVAI